MRIGCVVMASGDSRRFGGSKLLEPFLSEPLIAHALRALPEGLETVVVTRQAEIARLAESMGLRTLVHALADVSDTVRLGISALKETGGCAFVVGDQPLLTRRSMDRLIAAFEADPSRIVRASSGGGPGNPCVFPRALYEELMALPQGRGGNFVAGAHPELVTFVEIEDGRELMDCDTPGELRELERIALCSAKAD